MYQLNLPEYQFKIKKQNERFFVFDQQRKRYVALTPEEWVRQHFIRFLIEEMNYPASLLAIEHQIDLNNMKKRCDAVLFNNYANPNLIIEFKAPNVPITQKVFDQVAVYNVKLNVQFFMVSNGLEHYCCRVDTKNARYDFLPDIPKYEDFLKLII
ncbi:hypothetical protein D0T49_06215 [Paludibacter sp. 221]|uniref:type I restriction enzyme HsdR N-terminal domain-containing protein n=1 Tax=Paludibacter sp. 221 TaxID=2302939 RepID=UPI0013D05423|nr:type I restriction enzyme HsdR N-terminal domain-containing protein [Paludibacter sp. 221]NDV46637.1 hypothetical protein [Paludibacter sp. 221]